jgi:uncharacterized protein YndB with AHSA1/START domain
MTTTTAPQVSLSRVFNAPRPLVYKTFTDPDHFITWWGPIGNSLPRSGIDFDVRPGGHMEWQEFFPDDPETSTRGRIDLDEVVDGDLIDGTMRITGNLPGGFKPFETRMRLEFYDEPDGRTRVDVTQWLPESYAAPTRNGWAEAFSKLDATLGS